MNATLTSLVAAVYTLTNRPDLVGETLLAVKNATLKAHRTDYYPKDLFEAGIQFDFSLAQQSLDYKTLIPLWRSLKYLRKYDASTDPGVTGDFLEIITPDSVLDNYSITRENVCYLAGAQLNIRCRAATQYFLLGCYVYPNIADDDFNSWVATDHPAAIQYEAAATVFKTIGADEQVSTYRQMVAEEYRQLQATELLANGY